MSAHNHGPTEGRGMNCPEHTTNEGFVVGACMDNPVQEIEEMLDPRLDSNLVNIRDRDQEHRLTLSDNVGSVWVEPNGLMIKHKYTDFRVAIGGEASMSGVFIDTGEPWLIHLPPEILAAAKRQNIEVFRDTHTDFTYIDRTKKDGS